MGGYAYAANRACPLAWDVRQTEPLTASCTARHRVGAAKRRRDSGKRGRGYGSRHRQCAGAGCWKTRHAGRSTRQATRSTRDRVCRPSSWHGSAAPLSPSLSTFLLATPWGRSRLNPLNSSSSLWATLCVKSGNFCGVEIAANQAFFKEISACAVQGCKTSLL